MGQPIENQAAEAAEHRDKTPVEQYAGEALKNAEQDNRGIPPGVHVEATVNLKVMEPTSTPNLLLLAQQSFIAAQTAFIHDPKNLNLMFTAQADMIWELQHYVGTTDLPTMLSMQEAFISQMMAAIQHKGLG